MKTITAPELAAWLNDSAAGTRAGPQLLDVREPLEHAICQIPGSTLIPLREISGQLDVVDRDRPIVCICHHGGRSAQVAQFLEGTGIVDVFNLTGGVDAWAREVDPEFPRY